MVEPDAIKCRGKACWRDVIFGFWSPNIYNQRPTHVLSVWHISKLRSGTERRPKSIHCPIRRVQCLNVIEVFGHRPHLDDPISVFRIETLDFGSSALEVSLSLPGSDGSLPPLWTNLF